MPSSCYQLRLSVMSDCAIHYLQWSSPTFAWWFAVELEIAEKEADSSYQCQGYALLSQCCLVGDWYQYLPVLLVTLLTNRSRVPKRVVSQLSLFQSYFQRYAWVSCEGSKIPQIHSTFHTRCKDIQISSQSHWHISWNASFYRSNTFQNYLKTFERHNPSSSLSEPSTVKEAYQYFQVLIVVVQSLTPLAIVVRATMNQLWVVEVLNKMTPGYHCYLGWEFPI